MTIEPWTDLARWAQTVPGADFRRVYDPVRVFWVYASDGMWGRELWLAVYLVAHHIREQRGQETMADFGAFHERRRWGFGRELWLAAYLVAAEQYCGDIVERAIMLVADVRAENEARKPKVSATYAGMRAVLLRAEQERDALRAELDKQR